MRLFIAELTDLITPYHLFLISFDNNAEIVVVKSAGWRTFVSMYKKGKLGIEETVWQLF